MSWLSSMSGDYVLVSADDWHALADALDEGDLDTARQVMEACWPSTWPGREPAAR